MSQVDSTDKFGRTILMECCYRVRFQPDGCMCAYAYFARFVVCVFLYDDQGHCELVRMLVEDCRADVLVRSRMCVWGWVGGCCLCVRMCACVQFIIEFECLQKLT